MTPQWQWSYLELHEEVIAHESLQTKGQVAQMVIWGESLR